MGSSVPFSAVTTWAIVILAVISGSLGKIALISDRSEKLFPLFSIVRISNLPCTPEISNVLGTCSTNKQCTNNGGTVSGSCANGFGVCCVVTATCDSTVTQNNTNFRNRDFPNSFSPSGLEICNLRIQRPNSNICQVRMDMVSMNLAPADTMSGQCMTDRLSISGTTPTPPSNLCGDLSGQHMYFNYGSNDRITLSVITDGTTLPMSRGWNVRISYIPCNSILRAPDGCLQYYTAASGTIKMLGYPLAPHLADLDYSACVRSDDGAGSIVFSPCPGEATPFLMSGAAPAAGAAGTAGTACNTDYVLIKTDDTSATPKTDDRYCGSALTANTPDTVRSVSKPFDIRVKTDATEDAADMMNTGFCLQYRQEPPKNAGR